VVRLRTSRPVRASPARSQERLSRKRMYGRDRRRRRARKRAIRRVVRLGSARFVIPAGKTAQVKVRLSKKSYRLVKELKRVKVRVTVRDRDRAGRIRIGTREIFHTARAKSE
jgi:predicted metal-dependent hydrolase